MRLDKFLSACGAGTRSEVKKLIKNRAVSVNGKPAERPEEKIDEERDEICVYGKKLTYEKFRYYLLHKPAGCITAVSDDNNKTVMDYIPKELQKDLSPVGRLDLDAEGLLLLTNDGALLHHCISPSHHMKKTYFAALDKALPNDAEERFLQGIPIGDPKPALPAVLERLPQKHDFGDFPNAALLTITEGRFHQVKRMFEAAGCHVIYLKRLSMGPISLGDLEKGCFRSLTADEIKKLKED